MYVAGEEGHGRRGRKEGVYVAGGVLRKEREERASVCRRRRVTGEYVKEAVRGGETSSVFFCSPSSSAFFAAASSSFFFLRAAPPLLPSSLLPPPEGGERA